MNDQLTDYFLKFLNKVLCALRKKYSCQSLLIKMVTEWKTALDNRHITGAVFMDLSKAFDCLPHGLLIAKCHAYGLTYPLLSFSQSVLTNANSVSRLAAFETHGRISTRVFFRDLSLAHFYLTYL